MRRPDTPLRRLAREPLVHFALLAAGIFGLHRALAADAPESDTRVVSRGFDAGLRERYRRLHGAPPDEAEARELVREFVREEVLVREARRLALDRDDTVVRRRLVQKMELWIEATVNVPEPDERELQRALDEDASRYRLPARVAFEHVFFRHERPEGEGDARDALSRIGGGESAAALGDPFLLGRTIPLRSRAELAGSFGDPFARALLDVSGTEWVGPIESTYGWHLVRVTGREAGALPPLESVRDRVHDDVLRARRERAVRRHIDALIAQYEVTEAP